MSNEIGLYFLALLPPIQIQEKVTAIKWEFAENYGSRGALKSPPHVTLQPPFQQSLADVSRLKVSLRELVKTQTPIPMKLSGFGAFPPRVIYIDVIQTPELMALQSRLAAHLKANLALVSSQTRIYPFVPHMTVAFRDLTPTAFQTAWPRFCDRSLSFEFTVCSLTLLHKNDQGWEIDTEFPLMTIHGDRP